MTSSRVGSIRSSLRKKFDKKQKAGGNQSNEKSTPGDVSYEGRDDDTVGNVIASEEEPVLRDCADEENGDISGGFEVEAPTETKQKNHSKSGMRGKVKELMSPMFRAMALRKQRVPRVKEILKVNARKRQASEEQPVVEEMILSESNSGSEDMLETVKLHINSGDDSLPNVKSRGSEDGNDLVESKVEDEAPAAADDAKEVSGDEKSQDKDLNVTTAETEKENDAPSEPKQPAAQDTPFTYILAACTDPDAPPSPPATTMKEEIDLSRASSNSSSSPADSNSLLTDDINTGETAVPAPKLTKSTSSSSKQMSPAVKMSKSTSSSSKQMPPAVKLSRSTSSSSKKMTPAPKLSRSTSSSSNKMSTVQSPSSVAEVEKIETSPEPLVSSAQETPLDPEESESNAKINATPTNETDAGNETETAPTSTQKMFKFMSKKFGQKKSAKEEVATAMPDSNDDVVVPSLPIETEHKSMPESKEGVEPEAEGGVKPEPNEEVSQNAEEKVKPEAKGEVKPKSKKGTKAQDSKTRRRAPPKTPKPRKVVRNVEHLFQPSEIPVERTVSDSEVVLFAINQDDDVVGEGYELVKPATWNGVSMEEDEDDDEENDDGENTVVTHLSGIDEEGPFHQRSRCGLSDGLHDTLIWWGEKIYNACPEPSNYRKSEMLDTMKFGEEAAYVVRDLAKGKL